MKTFVISLGGSMIFPDKINTSFLKKFRKLILSQVKKGNKFVIITGGGGINRQYNKALKKIIKPSHEALDWLGISVTAMNAFFLRVIFDDYACPKLLYNPNIKIKTDKKIILGSGWKPGCSTDKDAVLAAKTYKAKTVINLTNVSHVYTKDPRKYKNAKKIENIRWKDFRKIVGDKWTPRLNAPFDPIAAKLAEKQKLKVVIAKGSDIGNLKKILDGKKFKGTLIR